MKAILKLEEWTVIMLVFLTLYLFIEAYCDICKTVELEKKHACLTIDVPIVSVGNKK